MRLIVIIMIVVMPVILIGQAKTKLVNGIRVVLSQEEKSDIKIDSAKAIFELDSIQVADSIEWTPLLIYADSLATINSVDSLTIDIIKKDRKLLKFVYNYIRDLNKKIKAGKARLEDVEAINQQQTQALINLNNRVQALENQ